MIAALDQVAIARGWSGGPAAVQRMMARLFCEAPAPTVSLDDDVPVTERCAALPASMSDPTVPARRLADGTRSDCLEDDLDERTRGRGPVRRPRSWLTA
jgi:hypothetical protein